MKLYTSHIYRSPDTQDVRDILVALAGCNGFESFTEEDNELIGYCQESVFNLHSLKKNTR